MRNSTKVCAAILFLLFFVCVCVCIIVGVHSQTNRRIQSIFASCCLSSAKLDSWIAELEPVVLEYFNSCDADECIESLLEVDDSTDGRIAAIIVAIELSLSRKNEERALVSHLLVVMAPHLCDDDFCRGVWPCRP